MRFMKYFERLGEEFGLIWTSLDYFRQFPMHSESNMFTFLPTRHILCCFPSLHQVKNISPYFFCCFFPRSD